MTPMAWHPVGYWLSLNESSLSQEANFRAVPGAMNRGAPSRGTSA